MEKQLWKVLLVEDNPGDARLMREYLESSQNPYFVLEWAEQLSKGLARLDSGGIDVVLLDLSLPDSRGLDTFAAVRERAPTLPLIILTGVDDEMLAENAVRQGAQDYLVKAQVTAAQLVRAIRYAIARQEAVAQKGAGQQGRIICFLGAKGGVGTTFVALNVATALARKNLSVALAEFRSSPGTLSHLLNTAPAGNLRHLLRFEPPSITPEELVAHMSKLPSGLRVLFGPQSIEEFGAIGPEHARAVIQGLARNADYVLLELPCEASESSRAAVQSCDFAVLVLEPEPLAVKAAKGVMQMLESWGLSRGLIGAVVVNRGVWGSPVGTREIHSDLGCIMIGTIPPGGEAVRSAVQTGMPLVLSRPESNAAAALNDLAARLIQSPVPAAEM